MNTFGRFDRRIGDPPKSKNIKQTGLSEEEKMDIELQAERLH